jgi:hypothetical protein
VGRGSSPPWGRAVTTTPTESMVIIQRGAVLDFDDMDSAVSVAASLYLLENELRPEAEWDPLPAHLTAEDIIRAKRRLEERRKMNRLGAAMAADLPLPLPRQRIRQAFICITMGCQAVSDRPGACEKCQRDMAAGKFDRISPRTMRIVVGSLTAIAAGCAVWAASVYPWSWPW